MSDLSVNVRESLESNRFEAVLDDGSVAGFAQYRLESDGSYRIIHTEVDDAYEGEGVGSRLAQGLLEALRERERTVRPDCPFIATWMRKHPETLDLLAEGEHLPA
jgi:predicted GNAT family acetyltransferase